MKNFCFLIFLIIYISSYGQNEKLEILNEKAKIDSIVEHINYNHNNYSEGIAEGSLVASNPDEKGGWEVYYLYKDENVNSPIRLIYNEVLEETYKTFEFFYEKEELIFTSLHIDFYEGKGKHKPIEKKFYFKNSKLIYESNNDLKKYDTEYIQRTEEFVFKMIQ